MQVLALTEGPNHVCARYRIEAFAGHLGHRGWDLEVAPLRHGILGRTLQLLDTRRADVVILQRKLLAGPHAGLLRRRARRLIYDFDDAMFQRDSFHRRGPASRKAQSRFATIARLADAVLAGNAHLHARAAEVTDPGRVHLMPTCVDVRRYPTARHHRVGAAVRLVWIGSGSTLPALKLAEAELAAVAERLPGVELRVVCDRAIGLPGVRVIRRGWSESTETGDLAQSDIGVSWLPDDSWSRGKCGLKVLQYMAAGLPVVANPVAIHRDLVADGRTGFLADGPQQWAEAVARLAADPDLRQAMGQAGRDLVAQQYSVSAWGPVFAAIVDAVGRPADASGGPSTLAAPGTGVGDFYPAKVA